MGKIGKIGRLPQDVREEVNRRLDDGQEGTVLLKWLNGLSVVKSILRKQFGGRSVLQQNLTNWKRGGYGDWQVRQEAKETMDRFHKESGQMSEAGGREKMMESMVVWVISHYLMAARGGLRRKWSEKKTWERMRQLCDHVVKLRRGVHQEKMADLAYRRFDLNLKRMGNGGDEASPDMLMRLLAEIDGNKEDESLKVKQGKTT